MLCLEKDNDRCSLIQAVRSCGRLRIKEQIAKKIFPMRSMKQSKRSQTHQKRAFQMTTLSIKLERRLYYVPLINRKCRKTFPPSPRPSPLPTNLSAILTFTNLCLIENPLIRQSNITTINPILKLHLPERQSHHCAACQLPLHPPRKIKAILIQRHPQYRKRSIPRIKSIYFPIAGVIRPPSQRCPVERCSRCPTIFKKRDCQSLDLGQLYTTTNSAIINSKTSAQPHSHHNLTPTLPFPAPNPPNRPSAPRLPNNKLPLFPLLTGKVQHQSLPPPTYQSLAIEIRVYFIVLLLDRTPPLHPITLVRQPHELTLLILHVADRLNEGCEMGAGGQQTRGFLDDVVHEGIVPGKDVSLLAAVDAASDGGEARFALLGVHRLGLTQLLSYVLADLLEIVVPTKWSVERTLLEGFPRKPCQPKPHETGLLPGTPLPPSQRCLPYLPTSARLLTGGNRGGYLLLMVGGCVWGEVPGQLMWISKSRTLCIGLLLYLTCK